MRDVVETLAELTRADADLVEPALEFLESLAEAGAARAQHVGPNAIGELLSAARRNRL
jgi:hypothetical protein